MNQDKLKQQAAQAALTFVEHNMVVGVGTGSTTNYFIEALATVKNKIEGAVPSSIATAEKLKALHIPIIEFNSANEIDIYVDGADEVDAHKQMIKGGGGALTREKILATAAKKFVAIVDDSKQVSVLGKFPVALEVLDMARSYVARQIVKMGGDPEYRQGFKTDNGHVILDIYHLDLTDALKQEHALQMIPGVVGNGIFARRKADVVLVGTAREVMRL